MAEQLVSRDKPRLLLHACCAPCSSSVVERLSADYAITILFYNPNIHPRSEHDKRRDELIRWGKQVRVPVLVEAYAADDWFAAVAGFEQEPERGERCTICYRLRLQRCAERARAEGFTWFTTVLSISPHKDAERINRLGSEIAAASGCSFYCANFKKQGGFQRSLELSRQYGFYRQNYCGCTFSRRESERRRQQRSAGRT